MPLEYTTAVDDLAEFSRFHLLTSIEGKHNRRVWTLTNAVVCIVSAVLTVRLALGRMTPLVITLSVLLGLLVAWAFRTHTIGRVAVLTRRYYAEGKNKGIIGWHRLTVTAHVLRQESADGTVQSHLDAIERIAETPAHVFPDLSAATAHVVPRSTVTAGDLNRFLNELTSRTPAAA